MKITISGDAVGARTLSPEVSFTKYVLSFEGPSEHENVTIQGSAVSALVEDLVVGDWTITATGYVSVSGAERAAAVGSAQIALTSGAVVQNLNISISAQKEPGVNGFFSYSITYPRDTVNSGSINIQPFNNNELNGDYRYLYESPATGTFPLAPGFYVMTIRLYDGYRDVIRAEIVHIYSNLETKAEYIFRNEDFNDSFILSGTVDVKVNGAPLTSFSDSTSVYIYAYLNPNGGNRIGDSWVNLSENNTWSMVLPAFDQDVTLYFSTNAYVGNSSMYQNIDVPVTVKNQNKSANLGTVDIKAIYVRGTINVTYDNGPMSSVEIYSQQKSGSTTLTSPGPNAPWSILVQAFDEPTDISFGVRGSQYHYYDAYDYYSEQIFNKNVETNRKAYNQDISGITINLGDFPNVFDPVNTKPLAADTWVDGEITKSYDVDWYSINVAAGTTYNLWCNQSWDGNYTKTLAVDVYAWYSNGTPVRLTSNSYAWSNPASFTARSNDTVYIRVRSHYGDSGTGTYGIAYNAGDTRPTIGEFTGGVAKKLQWIKDNTENGNEYTIEVTANESIEPQHLYYGGRTVSITIRGDTAAREISLDGNGSMFRVENGVTLILENITLRGHSDNSDSLITVYYYGNLETHDGVTITGNTAYNGGGVYVSDGTFTMSGGKISGNTAYYSGGGVYVSNGTFTKTGGTIYGYTYGNSDSNTVRDGDSEVQDNRGHAVYVYYNTTGGGYGEKRKETTAGPTVNLTFIGVANQPIWSGNWDE